MLVFTHMSNKRPEHLTFYPVVSKDDRFSKPVMNRVLNLVQEQVLVEYIQRLVTIGQSPRPGMLKSNANYILQLACRGSNSGVHKLDSSYVQEG